MKTYIITIFFIFSALVSFAQSKEMASSGIYKALNSPELSYEQKNAVVNKVSTGEEVRELLKYYSEFDYSPLLADSLLNKLTSLGLLKEVEDIAISFMKTAIENVKKNPGHIDAIEANKVISIVNSFDTFNPFNDRSKEKINSRFVVPKEMLINHRKSIINQNPNDWEKQEAKEWLDEAKENPTYFFNNYVSFLFFDYLAFCPKELLGTCIFYTRRNTAGKELFLPGKAKNIFLNRFIESPDKFKETNILLVNSLMLPVYMGSLTKSDLEKLITVLKANLFFKVNDIELKSPLLFILRYSLHSNECIDEYAIVDFWEKNKNDFSITEAAVNALGKSNNIYDINYAGIQLQLQGGKIYYSTGSQRKKLMKQIWERTEQDKNMPKYLKNALRSTYATDSENIRFYQEQLKWFSNITGDKVADD